MSNNTTINPSVINSRHSWIVVISASLLFFYSFMQLTMLNPISAVLMKTFQINSEQLGTISSMYFYSNCLLIFPAGLLLDRFSTRRLIMFAMSMAIIGMFGFAWAPNAILAGTFRFISGIGGSFCFLSCIRLASRWFPSEKMALVTGVLITTCMLGGLTAQTPMVLLNTYFGWRMTMSLGGVLGLIFLLIIYLYVQDWPNGIDKQQNASSSISCLQSIKIVMTNPHNWMAGAYTALVNLPIFLLGALWGEIYLKNVAGLSHFQSSLANSMLFVGAILGSPLAGWVSDTIKRRIFPMSVGAILSLFVILGIIYIPQKSFCTFLMLFFLLGLVTGTQILSYPVVTELNPSKVTGFANSIVSMSLIASGFIFQPMFGWLMNWHHQLTKFSGVIYSAIDFKIAMSIMPIAFVISFFITFFIKETCCKCQD